MALEKGPGQGKGKYTLAGVQKEQAEALADAEAAIVELSERIDALEAPAPE